MKFIDAKGRQCVDDGIHDRGRRDPALAEFVASKTGIGYLIWNSWELLQVDILFAGVVTIGILGVITSVLFQEIERKVIPWKAE